LTDHGDSLACFLSLAGRRRKPQGNSRRTFAVLRDIVRHLFDASAHPPIGDLPGTSGTSMAFSNAATSPPATFTAFKAASPNFFLFSRASISLRALVLELPLGATSLSSLAESLGVKFTKSITVPPVGVFGVFGVRGGREADLVRGDGSGSFGEIGGDGDREGERLCLRGVVNGEHSEKTDANGSRVLYAQPSKSGFHGLVQNLMGGTLWLRRRQSRICLFRRQRRKRRMR
ncbi:hypothetical protein KCU88_g389, partial [Aureobasidium melanogenum]